MRKVGVAALGVGMVSLGCGALTDPEADPNAAPSEGAHRGSGPVVSGDGERPGEPIFNDVTPLTPASLPDGWQRCSGGSSVLDGAGSDWWSQGFGPVTGNGECRPYVTVTQVPPDVDDYSDPIGDVIKVGQHDASHWTDEEQGSEGVFLWAFQQNLIVEACCGPAAIAELFEVAEAAYEGLHIDEPAHCTADESDISRERTVAQLSGADSRMYTAEGCPVRLDIVGLAFFPDDDHCWPGVGAATVGTPIGESTTTSKARHFYRDPDNLLGRPQARARLDLDAELSATAVDSGYRRENVQLWLDPTDDSMIYVVDGDSVEAWPLVRGEFLCA